MANKDSRSRGWGLGAIAQLYLLWGSTAVTLTWSSKISVIKEHFGISNKGLLKRICLPKSERGERKGWSEEKKKCCIQCGSSLVSPHGSTVALHLHKWWELAFCLITVHLLWASEWIKQKERKAGKEPTNGWPSCWVLSHGSIFLIL